MTELLTSDQMKTLEKAAIGRGEVTGLDLMEKAGQGSVAAILAQWPELAEGRHKVLVLCGPGNNGGDGFVIARLLHNAGWSVRVHLFGDPARLPPDAKANFDRWVAVGAVLPLDPVSVFSGDRPDLIVDAVFGIGLTRSVPDEVAQVLDVKGMKAWKSPHKIKRMAVDCPSGLDLDTGMIPTEMEAVMKAGNAWPATLNTTHLTVTFHTPKLGHYLALGPNLCGALKVVDIGLGGESLERSMIGQSPDPERVRLTEPVFCGRDVSRRWLRSVMGKSYLPGHKFNFGHVAVFAGGVGRGGAARLAARAALRAGAGLVTVICPPSALIENACQLNAIMLRALKKDQPLTEVADQRVTAFCLGPGMGVSQRTRTLVQEVLTRRAGENDLQDSVVVLDADALSSFAQEPQSLFAHTHSRTILTPHEGEFARLFPDLSGPARATLSKVEAVRQAAARAGCLVLLKGADTIIGDPQGGVTVHAASYGREVPWLATAGAGDVLAGLIAGLAAPFSSGSLFCAAELAVYLHVECARTFGPGLIAEDLPDVLPKLFRELGL
ncbi:MAG: NAD(P)H-hydrate dehydratase [Sulfitobacter sp.]